MNQQYSLPAGHRETAVSLAKSEKIVAVPLWQCTLECGGRFWRFPHRSKVPGKDPYFAQHAQDSLNGCPADLI